MSNNPYAVNGYGGPPNGTNPYAPTNTSNSVPSNRYADPYLNRQNNASSASVNSYNSQDRRRGSNPYAQRGRDSPAPVPSGRVGSGQGSGGGGYGGGYGGLSRGVYDDAAPAPRNEYDYGRQREPQEYVEQRQQQRPPTRDRAYNDSRSREGRDARPAMPPPSTIPSRPSVSSLNQQSQQANGYTNQSYPPPENANRQYSPRRPVKSMDEILRHIQSNWKDMEGDECVPVKIALKLMDPSSLGLADKEGDFANTHVDLQKSLKGVVNEHYADFNSAVGTYHKIQNAIMQSQSRVRQLKSGLMNVKGGMLTTKPELRGLAEQSGELDHMLVLLGHVESLKTVPSKLEEKISEKKFLGAVDMLMDSLKAITKSEFDGIGAVSDLRSYFVNQESTLFDILVEELHDHLYLRSPYCRDRWKGKKANGDEKDSKDILTGGMNAWDRPFNHYLNSADLSTPMVEDASKNPEADTFYYIHMILESLHKLGQLGEAVSRIEQRMPTELYKVTEKTNHDIDARYPSHVRGQLSKDTRKVVSLHVNDGRAQVLSDFLWTLYSKFEAIAESHRVLHEVIAGIATRENLAKPDRYTTGFKELWKLYQMEMRSLLHDYLATDGGVTLRSGLNTTSTTDIFARPARDKSKKMFKLSEMDKKSDAMKTEEDELDDILKSSVPGLVSKSRAAGLDVTSSSSSDRITQDSTAAGHKLLIEPGVFNMTILLPPSLTFLQRLKDVVPASAHIPMSTLTSFLDDFLINVFHPQLEEAVTELCTQCMIDLEAFSEDTSWSKHSPHPIFKGTISFMALIRAFSGMLSAIPQEQIFTQLIITQLVTYYDKCYGYYKALVSRVAPSATNPAVNTLALKAAAALADQGDVRDAALTLRNDTSTSASSRANLIAKEVHALLSATKQTPLSSYDIISDPKSVHQLSLLYNSMQWTAAALAKIRNVDAAHQTSTKPAAKRWTLLTGLRSPSNKPASHPGAILPIYLPLTSETAIPFDNTVSSFRALAQTSLLTLHIDIRCGIIHQLSRTLRGPNPENNANSPISPDNNNRDSSLPALDSGLYPYVLSSPPSSASPLVLELNNDLISFDSNIAMYLPAKEREFIILGLAALIDRFLVAGTDYVGVMNIHGAERLRIDATVIQQNLRAIMASTDTKEKDFISSEPDAADSTMGMGLGISTGPTTETPAAGDEDSELDSGLLSSSTRYFNLFLTGPESILQYVRDAKAQGQDVGYTYDELRTLIELWYSAKLRGEDREESIRARKGQQEVLLALGEVMWDS